MKNKSWFKIEEAGSFPMLSEASEIYEHIDDVCSREMFSNALLFSITNDPIFIRKNIDLTQTGALFFEQMKSVSERQPLIYGAGVRGNRIKRLYPEIKWGEYVDKSSSNISAQSKENKCISPDHIDRVINRPILISVLSDYKNICQDLLHRGVHREDIIILEEWNEIARKDQYFERRCIEDHIKEGAFIDAGSYDGMDTKRFLEKCPARNDAWVFEPDHRQMAKCKEILRALCEAHNVIFFEKGLSSKEETLAFSVSYGGLSRITYSGQSRIECTTIDKVVKSERVAYIKMDIEGYEEQALRGSEKTIRTQKPFLAISIYHRRADIIRIPKLILSLNPEYHFKLGHYSIGQVDTVLYAYSD